MRGDNKEPIAMKRAVFGLGIALSATALGGAGCATDGDDGECQPGDIDCAEDGGGGKADAWNSSNDPALLSTHLNYRLAELPKHGKLDKPAWKSRFPNAPAGLQVMWPETYFPTAEGSTNVRWLGGSVQSPLEKYDRAFNNAPGATSQPARNCGSTAKADWEAYKAASGPAAKWHVDNFQYMGNGHNGRDDDNNGQVDECSGGVDGWGPDRTAAGWWGLCHAWTPASMLEPDVPGPVTVNGVTFERSDIHALLMTLYDRNRAIMIGGRCNSRSFDPDNTTDANDDCLDTNAGTLHVVLTNALGLGDMPMAMDRTAGDQVWNQPIYSYDVTKQAEISKTKANQCVGSSGSSWSYNPSAKKLYEVEMTVTYLVEGSPSRAMLDMNDYLSSDDYHYILELDGNGKVIGGRYCTDSVGQHPDFLWAPQEVEVSSYGRNPNVSLDKVRSLLNQALAGGGGGGTGTGPTFENTTAVTIPDNDPAGIASDVRATGVTGTGGLAVTVNISHTYRGDLVVSLWKDGRQLKVLSDAAGGSADDLHETYNLSASELTGDRNGTYTLKVVDTAAQDEGTLDSWKVAF